MSVCILLFGHGHEYHCRPLLVCFVIFYRWQAFMHSAGVDSFCQWSTKIYITDGARAGLWDKARVMIMQNAVLFLWIQAYHWGRPLKHNASKCRHELGKVGRPGGLELGTRQTRTTRSTSGDCQSSGLGAQMPGLVMISWNIPKCQLISTVNDDVPLDLF